MSGHHLPPPNAVQALAVQYPVLDSSCADQILAVGADACPEDKAATQLWVTQKWTLAILCVVGVYTLGLVLRYVCFCCNPLTPDQQLKILRATEAKTAHEAGLKQQKEAAKQP